MSDTFFTASPYWGWWIILYFFVGGIAGAAFFLASLMSLFDRSPVASRQPAVSRATRPIVRLGYYLAFVGVVLSGLLLTVDLTRPLRFWHMLIENHTGQPMFKLWEPMSTGAWALLVFGLFAFLAALAALSEERPNIRLLQSAPVRFLRGRGPSGLPCYRSRSRVSSRFRASCRRPACAPNPPSRGRTGRSPRPGRPSHR